MRLRVLFEDLDDKDEFGHDCALCLDNIRTVGPDFHDVHIGAEAAGVQAYYQSELGKIYNNWQDKHGNPGWDQFTKEYFLRLPYKEQQRLSVPATRAQHDAKLAYYEQHGYTYVGTWGGHWAKKT